jgi:ATP-dependent exoDNAse (exonuclease V) alpha subunit
VKVQQFGDSVGEEVHQYHSKDSSRRVSLEGAIQERVWKVSSTAASDALGKLPLVPGMKVMVTENIAMTARVVNGSEGRLVAIKWEKDELHQRYGKCAYVEIKGSNVKIDGLEKDVVPIFPVKTYFKFRGSRGEYPIVREQLPLVPAYAFTDYKSQGRTLDAAIVDISDCRTLQNLYVMLSRCRKLEHVAII